MEAKLRIENAIFIIVGGNFKKISDNRNLRREHSEAEHEPNL